MASTLLTTPDQCQPSFSLRNENRDGLFSESLVARNSCDDFGNDQKKSPVAVLDSVSSFFHELVTCEACGCNYSIAKPRRHRPHRRLCVTCRSRAALAKGRESYVTPESDKAQRIRANGLVNRRRKLGWFKVPAACMKCGGKKRLDSHHTDYSKAHLVHWVCRSCHMTEHHRTGTLDGIKPFDTGGPPDPAFSYAGKLARKAVLP